MMAFTVILLTPAVRDAGPEGGKVMTALQRRGVMLVTPLIALGTLVSGMWLYQRFYGGFAGTMAARAGFMFGIGGAAAHPAAGLNSYHATKPSLTARRRAARSGRGDEHLALVGHRRRDRGSAVPDLCGARRHRAVHRAPLRALPGVWFGRGGGGAPRGA